MVGVHVCVLVVVVRALLVVGVVVVVLRPALVEGKVVGEEGERLLAVDVEPVGADQVLKHVQSLQIWVGVACSQSKLMI